MKLIEKVSGLKLSIGDDLIDYMRTISVEHLPNEYGGLLVGRYMDAQTVSITGTVLVPTYRSTPISFERECESVRPTLERMYSQKPKLHYVGEWHTHPFGSASPSGHDRRAMAEIAESKDVDIQNPVLLIIGLQRTSWEAGFYLWRNNELLKYVKQNYHS